MKRLSAKDNPWPTTVTRQKYATSQKNGNFAQAALARD
jgi:hypothetical protein